MSQQQQNLNNKQNTSNTRISYKPNTYLNNNNSPNVNKLASSQIFNVEPINDFNSSANNLCKRIYSQRDRYNELDGRFLNGFQKACDDQYQTILSKLSFKELTMDNIHDILFKIFITLDHKEFQPDTYKL
jgi:hypothetical protein